METVHCVVHGVNIPVTLTGTGQPLVCLHGWGASHEAFRELRAALRDDPVRIIAPDLPGFGQCDDPPRPWRVDDYADVVDALVHELGLSADTMLLGHSFGGRIALKLAARQTRWMSRLFLCAAAGLPQKRYLKRTIGHMLAKSGAALLSIPGMQVLKKPARTLLYTMLREHDYEKTSGVMRETMINVISEDLSPLLEMIAVPTDIFWGADDRMTPLSNGAFMNKKIVHSNLHVFPNVRHNVHRARAHDIAAMIRKQR